MTLYLTYTRFKRILNIFFGPLPFPKGLLLLCSYLSKTHQIPHFSTIRLSLVFYLLLSLSHFLIETGPSGFLHSYPLSAQFKKGPGAPPRPPKN